MRNKWRLETRVVHVPGERGVSKSITPPIFHTSIFELRDAEEAGRVAQEIHPEHYYTRWGNPTTRLLERALAELESGEDAIATSSGMGAISAALLTVVKPKSHVVAGKTLYTATEELLTRLLSPYGVETTFVDTREISFFRKALRRETSLIYIETPANPTLDLTDISAVAKLAQEKGIPLAVDNTFATPFNQNPVELGATIVLHSATKYIAGHSDVTAGVVIGDQGFIRRAWKVYKLLGPTLSPLDSWLLLRSIRTFALRMERHNTNAMSLASFLEEHKHVLKVNYPGLKSHPQHKLARRQMKGFGGMLSFEVKDTKTAVKFVESLRLCRLAVSLGGVETLVEHPASMSHATLTEEERRKGGVGEGLIRVSVGIENIEDLKNDFDQALQRAVR